MRKPSIAMFVLVIAMAVLAMGCNPFSTAPADRTRGTPFSIEVRWQAGGGAGSRGLINDPLVASVWVEVLSSGGGSIGSGSLHKGAGYWWGTIQVSQLGQATFLATAKDAGGAELYYGEQKQTLSGVNDVVTVTVSRQVRGIVTTFAGTSSADGIGSAAVFNSPYGIASDGTNLYVADTYNCTIRKIVIATGEVTTLAGVAGQPGSTDGIGSAARFFNPRGITIDEANIYVADSGNYTIRKIAIATAEVTTLAGTAGHSGGTDGIGSAARFFTSFAITTDGTNLYVADTYNCTIRQIVISTAEVTTLAGTAGTEGYADGTGSDAAFDYPEGITTDGANLYVADYNNSAIRKIVISTAEVTTLSGTDSPVGITTDGTNLYVADIDTSTIRKIVISTGDATILAGTAGQCGSADGMGSAAAFNNPSGIAYDGANLYVTDIYNGTIRKIVPATAEITTLAGSLSSTDGAHSSARFFRPRGITTDGTNLYITEYFNDTIRKIVISTGEVATVAGMAGQAGSTDGMGSAARFNSPYGITTDGTNLYVADYGNQTIRKIVIATGEVTTFAGTVGVAGCFDAAGIAARFSSPSGITTDGTNLYVTDYGTNTIRKIVIASAEVTTLAGTAFESGSTDGTGSAALFSSPSGITTDGTNLYIADYGNQTIRKIVIATRVVTTLAGTAHQTGSTDGVGSAARFLYPSGITTDGINLFVSDHSNYTIRKIVITTGMVTTLAGTARTSGSTDGTGGAARFKNPYDITTDGTSLYVTDGVNNTIRKIE